MQLQLPKPIEIYIAAENADDADALAAGFAPDATVKDEARTIQGLNAIKAWKIETKKKYQHSVEPIAVVARDGKTIVTVKLTGNFPGSPIEVELLARWLAASAAAPDPEKSPNELLKRRFLGGVAAGSYAAEPQEPQNSPVSPKLRSSEGGANELLAEDDGPKQ